MFFAAPWALLGLVAAAIPLLLHLVQRHQAPEVVFPAVRYLQDATRDQQRRVALQHWLLLLVRTLLIVVLVLAAAGATIRRVAIGPHVPAALVLVVDNSAGSGAVVDGVPVLTTLVRAANRVLDHAGPGDRLWLVTADGAPQSGGVSVLRASLALLQPLPRWFDLGHAIDVGYGLMHDVGRSGQVVVVTAAPRNAVTAAHGTADVLVIHPANAPPANRAVTTLSAGLQPWGPAGGQVSIGVTSSDTAPVPVTLTAGTRPLRDVLITPGTTVVQHVAGLPAGWTVISATLPSDEFRADDAASVAVRVAPPPAVAWDSADHFVDAAARVLAADSRIRIGAGVSLGTLGTGASVVFPPSDPARIGALNRTLAARASAWRFGALVVGHEATDTGAMLGSRENVSRRYVLERVTDGGDVLASVSGSPWAVRSADIILVGSRLDTSWSALPLSAAFVPFLDALLTSTAPGAQVDLVATAGRPLALPPQVTGVVQGATTTPVDGAGRWFPPSTGVAFALAGRDTIGAIAVRLDSRISDLARASDGDVRALWPGATVATVANGADLAFATTSRGDLRGVLLLIGLACVLAELGLTGRVSGVAAAV